MHSFCSQVPWDIRFVSVFLIRSSSVKKSQSPLTAKEQLLGMVPAGQQKKGREFQFPGWPVQKTSNQRHVLYTEITRFFTEKIAVM